MYHTTAHYLQKQAVLSQTATQWQCICMCTVYIIAFFESVYYYNNNAYKSAQNTKQKKTYPNSINLWMLYLFSDFETDRALVE